MTRPGATGVTADPALRLGTAGSRPDRVRAPLLETGMFILPGARPCFKGPVRAKADMLERARFNRATLSAHELYATGTTGPLIGAEKPASTQ